MSLCLTDEEVASLTHKKRCDAQVRALREMGIDHWVRGDGTPAVLRENIKTREDDKVKEHPFGPIKRASSTQA